MRIRKHHSFISSSATVQHDHGSASSAAGANSSSIPKCRDTTTLALCKLLMGLSQSTSNTFPASAACEGRLQLDTTYDGDGDPPIAQHSIGSSFGHGGMRPEMEMSGAHISTTLPVSGLPYHHSSRSVECNALEDQANVPLHQILSSETCPQKVPLQRKQMNNKVPSEQISNKKEGAHNAINSVQSQLGYGGKEALVRTEKDAGGAGKMQKVHKRPRSVRRNSYMAFPLATFKGPSRRVPGLIISEQRTASGVWHLVLQLMYSKGSNKSLAMADNRVLGTENRVTVSEKMMANAHILNVQPGRIIVINSLQEECGKEESSETEEKAHEKKGKQSRLRSGQQCKRKDGRGWQCSREVKEGYTYCEHHLVKLKANHARSAMKLARMKREALRMSVEEEEVDEKKRKRRCFKSLQEIGGGCNHKDAEEEMAGPTQCLLNSNPTEWRSDLL